MSQPSAQELFPNLFNPRPAKPRAKADSAADMRLVQFLMRQMGTRRHTPASAPISRPALKAHPGRTPIPARPAAASTSVSRPLPRVAQR